MPRNLANSAFMKPFVVLALPGMYLFYKYNQYKQQQQEQSRRKVTERELAHLNHKIDKLLTKLEENEPEMATSQEDECVICVNAKATMQTSPCGHRVVCRKCFVKTIQMAVSQRLLPLRCVICRAKILRLKQSSGHGLVYSKSWLMPSSASSYSMSAKSWSTSSCKSWNDKHWVPSSASQYSMGNRSVPNSASMYSMTSGSSSLSGVSSVSSATNSSTSSKSSSTSAAGSRLGYPRQPTGSLRKSQQYSMKLRIQEYNEPRNGDEGDKPTRLPPIIEFQREYRLGKERATSSSTRIRCAQKIVTQLETPLEPEKPLKKSSTSRSASTSFFRSSMKSTNKDEKKKEKAEDKKKSKSKEDVTSRRAESVDSSKEAKDKKSETKDNKTGKKDKKNDADKKEDASKSDKKETKSEKKLAKNEAKKDKKDAKSSDKVEKDKTEKKETLL